MLVSCHNGWVPWLIISCDVLLLFLYKGVWKSKVRYVIYNCNSSKYLLTGRQQDTRLLGWKLQLKLKQGWQHPLVAKLF